MNFGRGEVAEWLQCMSDWGFTHYGFVKTNTLITCEKPSFNTLYWIFNVRNIANFWKCRKRSILRTSLRKIEQGFPYPYVTEWFIKLYFIYIHYLEYRKSCKSIFTFRFRKLFFSAPEPKAQVHYCDHALSVVRRPSVRPSSVRRPSVRR